MLSPCPSGAVRGACPVALEENGADHLLDELTMVAARRDNGDTRPGKAIGPAGGKGGVSTVHGQPALSAAGFNESGTLHSQLTPEERKAIVGSRHSHISNRPKNTYEVSASLRVIASYVQPESLHTTRDRHLPAQLG